MTDSFNVSGVVLPADQQIGDSLDARALALAVEDLPRYRAGAALSGREDELARDAYVAGFRQGYRRGGKEGIDACTELTTMLSDGRLQETLARMQEFIRFARSEVWREVRRV